MSPTLRSLVWKEWRERRLLFGLAAAWVLCVAAYAIVYELARGYRAPVASFYSGCLLYGQFVPIFFAMRASLGEVTQGTLQYLFEFQTQVALLTGMDVANASMYDGATSAAEAIMMAMRVTRRNRAIVSGGLHPHYLEVAQTHARFLEFEVDAAAPDPEGKEDLAAKINDKTACVIVPPK